MFEKTVNKTKAWKKLESHYKHFRKVEMKDLFACDADRAKKFSVNLEAMYVDYSKNRINDRTMKLLLNLARECDLENKIKAMFKGDKINVTERRPVLHIALRNRANTPIYVDGKNVMPQINEVLAKMKKFSDAVRFGEFKGQTGKKLTNIVNIGIGGSDLGPVMACEALRKYWAKDINLSLLNILRRRPKKRGGALWAARYFKQKKDRGGMVLTSNGVEYTTVSWT